MNPFYEDALDALEPPIEDSWWAMKEQQDAEYESEMGQA